VEEKAMAFLRTYVRWFVVGALLISAVKTRADDLLVVGSSVQEYARGVTLGRTTTLTFALPAGGTTTERATLEFFADASAKVRDSYMNEAPLVEIYVLRSGESFAPEKIDRSLSVRHPVALGVGRHVFVDVTSLVRRFGAANEELTMVIGSLSGMEEGDFRIRNDVFGDGVVAKLRLSTKVSLKAPLGDLPVAR
jgi:hypothetical protein